MFFGDIGFDGGATYQAIHPLWGGAKNYGGCNPAPLSPGIHAEASDELFNGWSNYRQVIYFKDTAPVFDKDSSEMGTCDWVYAHIVVSCLSEHFNYEVTAATNILVRKLAFCCCSPIS